jgi:putative alpha-1,2-mannosidase
MKHFSLLLSILILTAACCFAQQKGAKKLEVDYVNTIIGTPFAGFAEGLEGGGTLPCVGRPYAMTNFLAQTGENKMGRTSYVYEDKTIMGFLASHQPTVWMGDYGYVSVCHRLASSGYCQKTGPCPSTM